MDRKHVAGSSPSLLTCSFWADSICVHADTVGPKGAGQQCLLYEMPWIDSLMGNHHQGVKAHTRQFGWGCQFEKLSRFAGVFSTNADGQLSRNSFEKMQQFQQRGEF